jgi:hypothetical protein
MKTTVSVCVYAADLADLLPFFDIVNGFFNRCRGGIVCWFSEPADSAITINQIDYLAEIILSISTGAVLVCFRAFQYCRWWCGLSSVR